MKRASNSNYVCLVSRNKHVLFPSILIHSLVTGLRVRIHLQYRNQKLMLSLNELQLLKHNVTLLTGFWQVNRRFIRTKDIGRSLHVSLAHERPVIPFRLLHVVMLKHLSILKLSPIAATFKCRRQVTAGRQKVELPQESAMPRRLLR